MWIFPLLPAFSRAGKTGVIHKVWIGFVDLWITRPEKRRAPARSPRLRVPRCPAQYPHKIPGFFDKIRLSVFAARFVDAFLEVIHNCG